MPAAIHKRAERAYLTVKAGYRESYAEEFYEKWINLRFSAKGRGSVCYLTYPQYLKLAKKAGLTRPDQIGKTPYSYQMGRKKDAGDYVWGNCKFITMLENQRQLTLNGGRAVGDAKRSLILSGKAYTQYVGLGMGLRRRVFIVYDVHGIEYRGRNLAEFCRTRDLRRNLMSEVCNGIRDQHKGWTGHYEED